MGKAGILIVVVIVVALVVFGYALLKEPSTRFDNDDVELTGETKEFSVEAFQFGYEPSVIEVNQGDIVKITATSRDVSHGFAISEFGVSETLTPGQNVDIEFIASEKGIFSFYCNVPCGSGHGSMSGQLIVN